jgi:hypothetical protein
MGPFFVRRPAARDARRAKGVAGIGTTAPAAALARAQTRACFTEEGAIATTASTPSLQL